MIKGQGSNKNMSAPIYQPVTQKLSDINKAQLSSRVDVQPQVDARCGFWMCKPACMQWLARIGVFTGFFSFSNMLTQTLTYYVNSQVTTLERQFGFSSRQTGIIMSANEAGFLVFVLFAAHVASRVHVPRSLGATSIVFGISGIACSVPHFLFGASSVDPTRESINSTGSNFSQQSAVSGSLCDLVNSTGDPCGIIAAQKTVDQTALTGPEKVAQVSLIIIVFGMALQGFAKAPRSTYSVLYVDDNTSRVNTGWHAGIMLATSFLGPVSAFLLGGVFSRMYVTLEATKLTPGHPKWIGAWWLGFVVFGCLAIVSGIPLFCFPRKLPAVKVKFTQLDAETMAGSADISTPAVPRALMKQACEDISMPCRAAPSSKRLWLKSVIKHAREFLACVYRLFTNPVYVSLIIATCFHIFMAAGCSSFYAKYLERIFHLRVHSANYVTAGLYLTSSVIGAPVGGFLTKRYKMTAMANLKFTIVTTVISAVLQMLTLVFHCDQPTAYNFPGEENACNSGCNCRDNSYFPICGGDGSTYYSPCHAGCRQLEQGIYNNCTCISGGQATGGTCDYGCPQLYGYIIVQALRMLFTTLSIIPKMIVYMRCVPEGDRSMALSLIPFMSSLFGWLLAPIFFGNIIDSTCLIWDIKCLTRGRCLHYDNNQFRVKFVGYSGLCLVFAVIFLLAAYLYARRTRCLDTRPTDVVLQETAEMKSAPNDNNGIVNT